MPSDARTDNYGMPLAEEETTSPLTPTDRMREPAQQLTGRPVVATTTSTHAFLPLLADDDCLQFVQERVQRLTERQGRRLSFSEEAAEVVARHIQSDVAACHHLRWAKLAAPGSTRSLPSYLSRLQAPLLLTPQVSAAVVQEEGNAFSVRLTSVEADDASSSSSDGSGITQSRIRSLVLREEAEALRRRRFPDGATESSSSGVLVTSDCCVPCYRYPFIRFLFSPGAASRSGSACPRSAREASLPSPVPWLLRGTCQSVVVPVITGEGDGLVVEQERLSLHALYTQALRPNPASPSAFLRSHSFRMLSGTLDVSPALRGWKVSGAANLQYQDPRHSTGVAIKCLPHCVPAASDCSSTVLSFQVQQHYDSGSPSLPLAAMRRDAKAELDSSCKSGSPRMAAMRQHVKGNMSAGVAVDTASSSSLFTKVESESCHTVPLSELLSVTFRQHSQLALTSNPASGVGTTALEVGGQPVREVRGFSVVPDMQPQQSQTTDWEGPRWPCDVTPSATSFLWWSSSGSLELSHQRPQSRWRPVLFINWNAMNHRAAANSGTTTTTATALPWWVPKASVGLSVVMKVPQWAQSRYNEVIPLHRELSFACLLDWKSGSCGLRERFEHVRCGVTWRW